MLKFPYLAQKKNEMNFIISVQTTNLEILEKIIIYRIKII